MEEIIAKFREWDFHAGECPMCRLFYQNPRVRCVCHDGRAILMQLITLIGALARELDL